MEGPPCPERSRRPLIEVAELPALRLDQIVLPTFGRLPDIDLRLSVRRVRIGATRLAEIAAGLILADRRLDMTLSEGLEGEAGAKLHVVATPDTAGVAVKAQASSESIDLGGVLSRFSPHPPLTGMGSFSLSLEGHGGNLDTLAHALERQGQRAIAQRRRSLPEVSEELVPPFRTEAPLAVSPPLGARRFSEANFAGAVEHGIWTVNDGWIGEGPSQIVVDGTVDVADRESICPSAPRANGIPFTLETPCRRSLVGAQGLAETAKIAGPRSLQNAVRLAR